MSAPRLTSFEVLDDVALMAEAARGEVAALSTLYERHSALCLSMAVRMLGDHGRAEDLVHDIFVEVWRHAHAYEPARGSVRTWILLRVRSRALDKLRSAAMRREVTVEDTGPVTSGDAEDPSLAPDRAAVVRALAELPQEQRQVIELAYFCGLSSTEIAQQVGCPVGTVKSRTAAGIAKLRAAMHRSRGEA